MDEIVAVENLSKHYGSVVALQNASLTARAGEVVGILGPNGAGKTTLMRIITGILKPTSGRVRVNGLDIAQNGLETRRSIGFVSGDTQLYPRLSPRENLTYFGRLYQLDPATLRQRVDNLVDEFGMTAFAARPCQTLSSGQHQRVNLARAFLHDARLLIMDEPTKNLDVSSGRFVIEAIRRKREAGHAILFATHNMGEAEYLCDRIILLHEGRIIDTGTLPELLDRAGCCNLTDAFLHHIRIEEQPRKGSS